MSGPFRRACLAGALPALLVFTWFIAGGHPDLLARQPLGDFYDAQAHSLLDGHWDVPPDVLKVEAFVVDGRSYTYFGPVPALLRMPVAALTHRFDGRLTQVSMIAAFALCLWMACRVHWRIRQRSRGEVPIGRREQWAVAGFTFLVGAGSSLTFLASRPIVYHEASLWGVGLALAGFDALLAWFDRPTIGRLSVATLLSSAALLTRGSVGAGPLAATGLLLVGRAVVERHRRPLALLRAAAPLLLAMVIPVALYAGVNEAKFGSPFTVPFDRQVVSQIDAHRQDVLAENGGTIFGVKYLPSTVLQYVRPDALRPDRLFPYIRFPEGATNVGDVNFDYVDRSSSVTAAMPALTLLSIFGVLAMIRRRPLWPVAALCGGALAGVGVTLTIGFIAHRYTADALPVLVLAGAAGLQSLAPLPHRRTILLGAGSVALLSVLVTAALTARYQRLEGIGTTEELRAGFVGFQVRDAPTIGDAPVILRVALDGPRPAPKPSSALLVRGECAALYRSDGRSWLPVERTPAGGRFELALTIGQGPRLEEVVSGITLERMGGGRYRFRTASETGPVVHSSDGDVHHLVVVVDRFLGFAEVHEGTRPLLEGFASPDGAVEVNLSFTTKIVVGGRAPKLCRDLPE